MPKNEYAYHARHEALKAQEQMPIGWKIDVWKNLGWHWRLKCGIASIHPSSGGGFFCLLADCPEHSGSGGPWTSNEVLDTPMQAFKREVLHYQEWMKPYSQVENEIAEIPFGLDALRGDRR